MKTKILFLTMTLFALSLAVAACVGNGPATTTATPASTGPLKIARAATSVPNGSGPVANFSFALVTSNPRGDHAIVDAAVSGTERASKELGVKGDILEAHNESEQESLLRQALSHNYSFIVALAPTSADRVIKFAQDNPNQKFGILSNFAPDKLPSNVMALRINVHEGSFLVGLVAGLMSKTKTVGVILSDKSPQARQFEWAYKQGVLQVCPDCKVLISSLPAPTSDPTRGKQAALGQFDQGADIIFQTAGRAGEGVIAAAKETKQLAIGSEMNQDDLAQGNVVLSLIERVDIGTYLLVKNAREGKFQAGYFQVGLKEGATGLSWDNGSKTFEQKGAPEMTAKLKEVRAKVEAYRQQILSGSFTVCDALADAQSKMAACDKVRAAH